MKKPQKATIEDTLVNDLSITWDDIASVINYLQSLYDEYKDTYFHIWIERCGYDDGWFELKGQREETDQEYEKRLNKTKEEKEKQKAKELTEYIRLKAKYGDKNDT